MNPKCPKTLIDVLKHLYKIADDFPYSQLALALDPKNLFDLIRIFGGQKLYIPTTTEFTELIQFCLIEEIGDYDNAVKINSEVLNGFTKAKYERLANRIHSGNDPFKKRKRNHSGKNRKDKKSSKAKNGKESRGGEKKD